LLCNRELSNFPVFRLGEAKVSNVLAIHSAGSQEFG
jgi:hypothetical protein